MRERFDGGGEQSAGEEATRRRIELSVAQVAGSAVAAVVAAKLASYFGVYGTILGAGVVSVLATCGGSVFQHFFRRTGEQLRGVAASPGPVPAPATVPAGRIPPPVGEFTEGTVYRARIKSWKRPVLAAALVFGVTMAGITAYELVSGDSFSGGRGTTVGYAVTGHRTPSVTPDAPAPTSSPTGTPGTGDGTPPGDAASGRPDRGTGVSPAPTPEVTGNSGSGGGTGDTGSAATDGTGPGRPSDAGTTAPAPGASATAPAPSASSRSGTAAGDPAGPAAP
ncbi:hypothetical protein ACFC08_18495 [Streptomyces sp. NPDC056112]|uniref:hypothetical protein n=1 Tax=unclassified Streptomyces TaxID=2593676 RepID=UPI001CD32B5F|nr:MULTISPECIES: hypothetical protein [unclassified Streptomyces]